MIKWLLREWNLWQDAYIHRNDPDMPVEPTPKVPFSLFCSKIVIYEGANPANNNPYDFRYYPGGYLPKYGVVKESTGGFAMFETLALGTLYGETCITEMIQNHPTWNFFDFFNRFAPPSDNNNTVLYANTIARWCGVPPLSILSEVIQFNV